MSSLYSVPIIFFFLFKIVTLINHLRHCLLVAYIFLFFCNIYSNLCFIRIIQYSLSFAYNISKFYFNMINVISSRFVKHKTLLSIVIHVMFTSFSKLTFNVASSSGSERSYNDGKFTFFSTVLAFLSAMNNAHF